MTSIDIDLIQTAFTNINYIHTKILPDVKNAVNLTMSGLDDGSLRVSNKSTTGTWEVNEWIKKAILLFFKLESNKVIAENHTNWYDKVPLKYANYTQADFAKAQVRVVPPATVRYGAYVAPRTVLMPSYVNIGAYIDTNCMIDTWATVGSCAQIGKNVHISGGAGIGGVLEPLQNNPTIIEDNCFIGARSEIVEGVTVEEGAVISMGVFIGQSTKIYDRETQEISYGTVPRGSVVVPGNLPSKKGDYSLACAVIVKRVDEKTKAKVGINHILREACS